MVTLVKVVDKNVRSVATRDTRVTKSTEHVHVSRGSRVTVACGTVTRPHTEQDALRSVRATPRNCVII